MTGRYRRFERSVGWIPAGIFLVTLLAYLPAISGGFLWDDDAHVTKPVLRSAHGLWRIWFDLGATQQYYPLMHSVFWLEHHLWGDATLGYHLMNISLHAGSACLFAVVLRRLAIPRAWLAALIFALHPVNVESVAWITEQKNTLSTVFYLLSALVYLQFDQKRRWTLYFGALGLFLLAILTKSVTSTLPAALLVVLWWKRGRLSWRHDVAPLTPWFAAGMAAGLFTAWVERNYLGAEGAGFALSVLDRCLLAGRTTWFYLGKLVWPRPLIFIYPRWQVNSAVGWQYLYPAGVLALLALLWLFRRRSRAPLAALLLFVGSLFPALGFFNVYPFLFSYVADHFQYLAGLGLMALAAATVRVPPIAAAAVAGLLGVLTWQQCRIYRDAETLYRATLAQYPDCWLMHYNLAVTLDTSGRAQEALGHYDRAVQLSPERPRLHDNLGVCFAETGRLQEAIVQFREALRLEPDYVDSHEHIGKALFETGQSAEGLRHFEAAVMLNPDDATLHYDLGLALRRTGHLPEAIQQFEKALEIRPDDAKAHHNLGLLLRREGRGDEAIAQFEAEASIKSGRSPGRP